jgi:thioredoxin 1
MSYLTFTDINFEKEVLKSKELVLVDFWAPWCGPCQMMGPIIEELAEEYQDKSIKIGKLNVDENEDIPARYNIMSIPTLIFFKDGKPIEQLVGVQNKNDLKKKIEGLLLNKP